jgi:hypothetical protein
MFISAHKDRVTVIFSTLFADEDDVVFGEKFMQEFAEARKKNQAAPQVLYTIKESVAIRFCVSGVVCVGCGLCRVCFVSGVFCVGCVVCWVCCVSSMFCVGCVLYRVCFVRFILAR